MPNFSKVIKIDVLNGEGRKILSAAAKQISCPIVYEDDVPMNNVVMVKGSGFPVLSRNSTVFVVAYSKSGDRLKYTGLVQMSTDNQINIKVREFASLMEERRRYYKIESDLRCSVISYVRGDSLKTMDSIVTGTIRNFNIGGMFLSVEGIELKPKDVIYFSVRMENEMTDACAEVLRIQRNEDGGIEGYGCRFINTTAKQEELFAKYVYTKQLEERMKNQQNQ